MRDSNDSESPFDISNYQFNRLQLLTESYSLSKDWMTNNRLLSQELKTFKNKIDNQRKWDIAKKCANEYEFIFSFNNDGVANFVPISRSYFKMIELLKDHKLFDSFVTQPRADKQLGHAVKAACLCEGPGGFVQALNDTGDALGIPMTPIHCITLISNNKKVPNWKTSSLSNFSVSLGVDGTGDIYKIGNIDFFVREVGANSCDLVTADGGFDFSGDFNSQETDFVRLLLCEVYTCMLLQRTGGVFVTKMFDLFHTNTLRILTLLRTMYDTVSIHKPKTSRPANSEKYVICRGYRSPSNQVFISIRSQIMGGNGDIAHVINPQLYADTLQQVTKFNEYFVAKQICYIEKTLEIIRSNVFDKKKNVEVCKAWCRKYGIPIKPLLE